jgi:outer membrane protein TolC
MFKPIPLITMLILFPAFGRAEALRLDDVLAQAERSPLAQAALAESDAALHQSWAGFAWPDPQLAFEWMGMDWPDPSLGQAGATRIELSQSLPFPGRTLLMGLAQRRAAEAKAAEAAAMRAEAVMKAEAAWWRAQEARLALQGQDAALKALDRVAAVSARRARFGRLDRMGQVMDAMLRRDRARLNAMRQSLEQDRTEAQQALAAALGQDAGQGLNLADADLDALVDEARDAALLERARTRGPALRAAQARSAAAGLELASAASAWLPDLMLMGAVETPAAMPGMREASFRVGFNLPFVWAWAQGGRTLAARDERKAARLGLDQAVADAVADAENAAGRVRSGRAALKALRQEALAPAQRALDLALEAYDSGDVGAAEVMGAVMGYAETYQELAMQAGRTGMARAELRRLAGPQEGSHE